MINSRDSIIFVVGMLIACSLFYFSWNTSVNAFGATKISPKIVPIDNTANQARAADAIVSSRFVIDNNVIDSTHNCETCTKIVYTPGPLEKAGVAFKYDNLDLSHDRRIVFFARGETTTKVNFVAAGVEGRMPINNNNTQIFPRINFSIVTDNVNLTENWRRFEIGLNNASVTNATYAFGIQLAADSAQKQIFYIKGVSIDEAAPLNPLPIIFPSTNMTNASLVAPLTATIQANTTNATAPSTIEFQANSTGGVKPYSFSWRFGNESNIVTGEKALHTFDKPGDYAVTLEINDSALPSQNATAKMMVSIASTLDRVDNILANSSTLNQNETAAVGANSVNQGTDVWNGTNITKGTTEIAEMFTDNNTSSFNLMPHSNSSQSNSSEILSLKSETNTPEYSTINHDTSSDNITKNVSNNNNTTNDTIDPSPLQLVNHAPISADVVQPLNDNGEAKIVLKATDQDNDKITFEIVSSPMRGTIAGFNKDRNTLTYVGNSTVHGSDSFTFKSIDIHGAESNIGRVTVHSSTPNPLLQHSSNLNVATLSNTPVTITFPKVLGVPDDKNKFRLSIIVPSSHGKLGEIFDLGGTSAKAIYTPEEDYVGEDLIRYRVDYPATDTSSTGKVSIKVIAAPPTSKSISSPIAKDQKVLLDKNKELGIILGDAIHDGDSYSYSIVTKPAHGKILAFDPGTGKLTYKPDSKFSGQDLFTFMVSDQKGMHSKPAKVILQVGSISNAGQEREGNILESNSAQSDGSANEKAVLDKRSGGESSMHTNHNPSANAGPDRIVDEGFNFVPLKGTGSDPDGDKLMFSWIQTSGPQVQLNQRNSENAIFNASGIDSKTELKFSLRVIDGMGGHDEDSVKILVRPKTSVHMDQGQDHVQRSNLIPVEGNQTHIQEQ